MAIRTASCLCGSVKVEIRGEPVTMNLCHCITCQKNTGAPFASLAVYKVEDVTYTESEPSIIKTYNDTSADSGDLVLRSFCGRCGAPVKGVRSKHTYAVIIPVGLIDGDKKEFTPGIEFFCSRRADWVAPVEGSMKFETMPPPSTGNDAAAN